MTKLRPLEGNLAVFTKDLLDAYALPRVVYWHVPNEGKRSKAAGARLKKEGMRPGVSDWSILLPNGQFAALELKREGEEPNNLQYEFGSDVLNAGGWYAWVDTPEDVALTLWRWGAIRRPSFLAGDAA